MSDMQTAKWRAIALGLYIVENNATIREAAREFGIPKTTVHKSVTVVLRNEHQQLYRKVRKVLNYNWSQKTIRGGMATKKKFEQMRKKDI